jgi:predicted RNA-binding Zn ribbon-like protein
LRRVRNQLTVYDGDVLAGRRLGEFQEGAMPDSTRVGREPVTGPAPGRLEHVRAFVNTLDIEAGTDELDSPGAIADWLRSRELIPGPVSATPGDLSRAVRLREALREVLSGHVGAGHRVDAPLAGLREITDGLAARLEIDDDGNVRTVRAGGAVADGLAALMLIAAEASTLGTWQRLKVCSADDCRWAFYDRSPARTGCWCSMAVCGSRAKSRSFRRRAATAGN